MRRRDLLKFPLAAAALQAGPGSGAAQGLELKSAQPLKITALKVTPIALPDPPLLAAHGCHGPYFLRNVIELVTDGGVVGWGETHGHSRITEALEKLAPQVVGQSVFAYRALASLVAAQSPAAYAGLELACFDAAGKATGRRV